MGTRQVSRTSSSNTSIFRAEFIWSSSTRASFRAKWVSLRLRYPTRRLAGFLSKKSTKCLKWRAKSWRISIEYSRTGKTKFIDQRLSVALTMAMKDSLVFKVAKSESRMLTESNNRIPCITKVRRLSLSTLTSWVYLNLLKSTWTTKLSMHMVNLQRLVVTIGTRGSRTLPQLTIWCPRIAVQRCRMMASWFACQVRTRTTIMSLQRHQLRIHSLITSFRRWAGKATWITWLSRNSSSKSNSRALYPNARLINRHQLSASSLCFLKQTAWSSRHLTLWSPCKWGRMRRR